MILTNKSSKVSEGFAPRPPTGLCTCWGAYGPPADFPMIALRACGVPKLTSGYATVGIHSMQG